MDMAEQLQQIDIFRGVDRADLEALAAKLKPETHPAGTPLFEKDTAGNSMYLILSGSIRIFTQDNQGNEFTIVVRRAGDVVGEMSLIDEQPRSASADAHEALEVAILERGQFLEFLRERPAVGLQMMRTLTGRIRYTTDYLQKVMEWINRLGQGDYDEALAALSAEDQEGEMQKLIAAFLDMVRNVKDREAALQQALGHQSEG